MDKQTKDVAIGTLLTIGAIAAMALNQPELAGVCFGAVAGYALKNSVQAPQQKTST